MLLVAHLFWPFVAYTEVPSPERDPLNGHRLYCDCVDKPDVDLTSCLPTANETERMVMRRDNYACIATGILWEGRETWEKDPVGLSTILRFTHVMKDLKGMFRGKERSFSATLELIKRFCGLPPQSWTEREVDTPDNLFILEPATQTAWHSFRCALVPDEEPAHYRLVNYLPYKFSGFQVAEDVIFVDHSKVCAA
ncbi:hypothetical protein C8T65DRAFT_831001 [Cerioporus squamosus]|nr:hypothetical protein C8T65DRAFT_831001 [Cerioporus squamosus]